MKFRIHHLLLLVLSFMLMTGSSLFAQTREFKITLHKSIYLTKWLGYMPSYVVLRHDGVNFTEGFAYYPHYNLTAPQTAPTIVEKRNFHFETLNVSSLNLSGSNLTGDISFQVRRIDGNQPVLLSLTLNSLINGDEIIGSFKGSFGTRSVIGNVDGLVYTGTVNTMQAGSMTMILENGMPGNYEDHLVIDVDFNGGVITKVVPDAFRYSPTHLGFTAVPSFKIIDTVMGLDGLKHKALFSPAPIRIVLDSHSLVIVGDSIKGRICYGYYTNVNGEPTATFRGYYKTQVRARFFGRQVFGNFDALKNNNGVDFSNAKLTGIIHNYNTKPVMPAFSAISPAPFKTGSSFNPPYFNSISQSQWQNRLGAASWWLHQAPESGMAYSELYADYLSPTAKQYDNNAENVYGLAIGSLMASMHLNNPFIKLTAKAAAGNGAYSFGTHGTGIYGLHNYYKNMFWTSFYRGLAFLELYEATKNPVWFEHSLLFADVLSEIHKVTQIYCPNCDGTYTYFDDGTGSVGSPNVPASEPINYPRPAGEALYILGKLRKDYGVTAYENTESALLKWHLDHMTTEPEFFKYRAGFGAGNTPSSSSATYLLLYLSEVAKPGTFTQANIDTLVNLMESYYSNYSHSSGSPYMSPSFTSHEHRHINGPLIDMAVASPNASAKVALAFTYLFEKYSDSTYLKKARELALFGLNRQNSNGLLHHLGQTLPLDDSLRIYDIDKHSYLNQKAEAVLYLYKTYRQLLKHEMIPGAIFANFTVSDEKPLTTTAISFDATSSKGTGLSYSWDFGDGTSGVGATPVKTFAKPGNYIVRLTVTSGGNTDYYEKGITVIPQQYLYRLEVDTAEKVVLTGSNVQFVSRCFDQNLTLLSTPTITWAITGAGNTISSTGLASLNGVAQGYKPYKVICKAVLNADTIIDSVSIYVVSQFPDTNGYRYLEYGSWLVNGVYHFDGIDYPGTGATNVGEIVWRQNLVSYPQVSLGSASSLDMKFSTRGDVFQGSRILDLNTTNSGQFRLKWTGRNADGYNSVTLDLSKALTIIPDTLHFHAPVTNTYESVWQIMRGSSDGLTWDTLGFFDYTKNDKARIDFPLKTVHPKIETVGSSVIAPGESVDFTSRNSIGRLLATNVTWNFGDGTPLVLGGITQTHTYALAGNYWAKLSMTRRGKTFTDSILITVTTDPIIGRIEITNPLHNVVLINDSLQFHANVYDRNGNLISSPSQPKKWHIFGPYNFTYGPWGAHVGFYCLSDSGIGSINPSTGLYKPFVRDSVYFPEDIVVTIRQGSNVFKDTAYAYTANRPRNTAKGYRYLRLGFGNIGSKVVRPIEVQWIDTNGIRYPEFPMHPELKYYGRFGLLPYSFVSGHVRAVDLQYDHVFTGGSAEYRADPNPHPSTVLDLGEGRTYGPDSLRMVFATNAGEALYMVALGSNNAIDWDTLKYIPNFKSLDTTVPLFTPAQTPPQILVQPSNTVVCEGDPINLSVTVKGSSPVYQWYRNGSPLVGATSNVFSKTPSTVADAGSYKVVVSNSFDTVTSNTVTLNVNLPVVQSVTVKLCNDETYQFGALSLDTGDAGIHTQVLSTSAGCDSTVNLTLQKGTYRLSVNGKMRGIYTVDKTGADCPFKTIQSALDALKYYGVDSAVEIRVSADTYNEQLKMDSIPGASASNKITIKGLYPNPDSVKVLYSPILTNKNYVFAFDGTDNVEVKYLTIQNASAGGSFVCSPAQLVDKDVYNATGNVRTTANPFASVRDSRMFIPASKLQSVIGTSPIGLDKIGFRCYNTPASGISGKMYMKMVTNAEWGGSFATCNKCKDDNDWVEVNTFTNASFSTGLWTSFQFSNMFTWNGTDHIVMKFCVTGHGGVAPALYCENTSGLGYYATTGLACGAGGSFSTSDRQLAVRFSTCSNATALRSVIELTGDVSKVSLNNTKITTTSAPDYFDQSVLIVDKNATLRGFRIDSSILSGGSNSLLMTSVGGLDSGVVIQGNHISGFSRSGVDVTGGESFNIDANTLVGSIDSSVGMSLSGVTGSLTRPFIVSNNALVQSNSASDSATGLLITGGSNLGIYYNSINHLGGGSQGSALKIQSLLAGSKVNVMNNIVVNKDSGYAIEVLNSPGLDSCDYNNYFSNGNLGKYNGTTASTLADWKSASGKDANSLNIDPAFVSATDLHLVSPGVLADAAKSITWVSYDFDGDFRNPDIGFDEFATPLSSKLIAFNSQCQGILVVRWTLANVKANTHVYLERSSDSINYKPIFEKHIEESVNVLKFVYNDYDADDNRYYYRLVEVSETGELYVSYALSILCDVSAGQTSLLVYPNPTHNHFNVRFTGSKWGGESEVSVQSIDGRLLYKEKVITEIGREFVIDANEWSAGMYILNVQDASGERHSIKVVRW